MNAENAKISYESGQNLVSFVALDDSGDHVNFLSDDELWSNRAGYTPVVKPNGLATGGAVSVAASGSKDVVDIAALTCYLAGILTTVGASADVAIERPSISDYVIYSICVLANGTFSAVKGVEGSSFADGRGAAGSAPYIALNAIEIAQVWLSSKTPAVITADEIKQVVGTHCERYDYPTWEQKRFNVENGIIGKAGVEFDSALPLIHSAASPVLAVAKKVYAQYYTPSFTDIPKSDAFVPAEISHTVSSKQIYGTTLGSSSQTLGQGTFNAYLEDGISDGILALKNQELFFKFYQNRLNSTPYLLGQGKLGISRTFPAADHITAACTISCEQAFAEVVG